MVRTAIASVEDAGSFLRAIREIGEKTGVSIVCLNAELIAGMAHAKAAVERAMRAFDEGCAISNSFEMEVLLYAAATRQCSVAMEFGIRQGGNRMYVCTVPPSECAMEMLGELVRFVDADWDGIDSVKRERLMRHFGITQEEIEAIGEHRLLELVLERVTLLDIFK